MVSCTASDQVPQKQHNAADIELVLCAMVVTPLVNSLSRVRWFQS